MAKAKGAGRPNKYETNVKPRLAEIEQLCQTMTEKQIAESLGVSYSSWNEYKTKYSELTEAIKKGRQGLVKELRSELIRKAKGFKYTEKKIIKENGVIVREEIYEKASLPDVAALNLLLKNYDKENWSNDPQMLKLREKELELRERQVDATIW